MLAKMASSNVLPRRGAKLLSLHSHVSARAWNCRVQSLVTRKFLKNEGTIPKSWSLETLVLADTDCDFSASENVTDSPTASVRITARMGKTGATNKRARNGTSGESTPESRIAEIVKDSQEDDGRSEPSEDGQDDARRAGEQVLNLLKGVDQKKLIALLQSGALEDVMTSQVQGAKKLAKVVQECVCTPCCLGMCVTCMTSRATILTLVFQTGPARSGLNYWNQWIPSRKRSLLLMLTRTTRLSTDVRV